MCCWGTLLEEIYLVLTILGEDSEHLKTARRDLLERAQDFRLLLESQMECNDSDADDEQQMMPDPDNSYAVPLGIGESLFDLLGLTPDSFSRSASLTTEEIMSADLLLQLAALGEYFEAVASDASLSAFCCAHMKQQILNESLHFSCPSQLAKAIKQEAFVQWIAAAHLYSGLRSLDSDTFGCPEHANRLYLELRGLQNNGGVGQARKLVEETFSFFAPRILEVARLDAPDEDEHRVQLFRGDGSIVSSNTVANELERALRRLFH